MTSQELIEYVREINEIRGRLVAIRSELGYELNTNGREEFTSAAGSLARVIDSLHWAIGIHAVLEAK